MKRYTRALSLLFAVIIAFSVSCGAGGGEVSKADLSPSDAKNAVDKIVATDNPGTLSFFT